MRNLFISLLLLMMIGSLTANALGENRESGAPYAMDRIKIKLSADAVSRAALPEGLYAESNSFGINELDQIFSRNGGQKIIRSHRRVRDAAWESATGFDRWFIIKLSDAGELEKALTAFRNNRYIEHAGYEYIAYRQFVPNDPLYPNNWGHNNTAQLPRYQSGSHSGSGVGTPGFDSRAQQAWDDIQGMGSASIIIAIIDSGVDTAHPDLRLMAGYDYGDNDANPMDDSADPGHGTACSGVAAAIGNNNLGVAGIAAGCTVMPLKASDSAGDIYFTYIVNALTHAADNGAHIASLSLGAAIAYGASPSTDAALAYAYNNGVTIFAATANANTSTIDYPANHPNVISVGAASPSGERKSTTSSDGENWWGSNYGVNTQDAANAVDLMAPTILPTTDISGAAGYSSGNYDMWFNGTSCATPYAAGVAALVLSKDPSLSPAQLRQALTSTATDMTVDGGAGWDRFTGYGMVNAYAAVSSLDPPPVISYNPSSIDISLAPEASSSTILSIGNTGTQTLNYSITKPSTIQNVLTESFESTTIPTGWSQEYVSGSLSWIYAAGGQNSNPANAYHGSRNARLYINSFTPNVTKLVTPALDLSNSVSANLSFWHAQVLWPNDQDELRIYYKIGSGAWNLLATYTQSVSSWTQRTLSLPNPAANYYIAFEGTAKYGYGVCLDYVEVNKQGSDNTSWFTVNGTESVSGSISHGQANHQINIGFDASGLEEGSYNSHLIVTSNSVTNSLFNIPISMEVAIPAIPEISLNLSELDFGYVLAGLSQSKDFEISNPGSGTLSGSIVAPVGYSVSTTGKQKTIKASNANRLGIDFEIPAGQSESFVLSFSPLEAVAYNGNLVITHNADSGESQIIIKGIGNSAISVPFASGFESGWGVWKPVNGNSQNFWINGTTTSETGDASIYISNNAPAYAYDPNSASIVHFFADISIPSSWDNPILRFAHRGVGETSDNLKVWLIEPNLSPVAGTQVGGILLGNAYFDALSWSIQSITLSPDLAGLTKRFVFTWTNDASGGNQTPAAIDNIRIVQGSNTDVAEVVDGFVEIVSPIVQDDSANPISVEVEISGLTATFLSVDSAYDDPSLGLENVGLSLQLSGANFANLELFFRNLGFVPRHLAYRVLPSENWIFVPNPGSWTAELISFVVATFGKAGGDLQIAFPDSEDSTLPLTLSSFTALQSASNIVELKWTTHSEANLLGYYILRSRTSALEASSVISNLIEAQNSSTEWHYAFTDGEVQGGETYYYWLQSVEQNGFGMYYGTVSLSIEITDPPNVPELPLQTMLLSAFPNPFNPTTSIRYAIKDAATVTIEIFNLKGQMLKSYTNTHATGGYYSIMFDGKDANGRDLGSGVYYYKMISGSKTMLRKMVLMK